MNTPQTFGKYACQVENYFKILNPKGFDIEDEYEIQNECTAAIDKLKELLKLVEMQAKPII